MSLASFDPPAPRSGTALRGLAAAPVWVWFGAGLFLAYTASGDRLLQDPDTFWHIAVGQDILARHAFPVVDTFSFSRAGAAWTSSSWLSQVLFAGGFAIAGWAGPVLLSTLAIAATFAQVVRILARRFDSSVAVLVAMVALALCAHHLLARPHVLAMPVMVAWVHALTAAADRRGVPSFWQLPLMTLWVNLHGGFLLGLMLIGPFAFDALWSADKAQRKQLLLRWVLFGLAAVVACCITPYGWGSLLAASKILELGSALLLIPEWQSANFTGLSIFELCLLVPLAAVLLRGISLPLPRILLVVGLVHMALAHNRNFEVFALLMPLVVAAPLAAQLSLAPRASALRASYAPAIGVVLLAIVATGIVVVSHTYRFAAQWTPVGAVNALREHKAARILNDPSFGGYLITQGLPTFIDGRAELYGERFVVETLDALALRNLGGLFDLLDTNRIDATLLQPSSPAVQALDRLGGWRRVYTDDVSVVHVRASEPLLRPSNVR